jgi:nitrate/nitrite-specific signal transduction histidine kinase
VSTTQSAENREPTLADVIAKLDVLTEDLERSNERFTNYQQAVQWVVQLAFSLIASATVTIVISSVLRR